MKQTAYVNNNDNNNNNHDNDNTMLHYLRSYVVITIAQRCVIVIIIK